MYTASVGLSTAEPQPSGTFDGSETTFADLHPFTRATIVGVWLASIALSFGDVDTIVAWMLDCKL